MTMKSVYNPEITASLSARGDVVGIYLNWDNISVSIEQFVKEIMALEIPGLTYKNPLPTKRGVYADKQGDVWVISEDGEKLEIVACGNERWRDDAGELNPEQFAPFTPLAPLVPKEES